MKLATLHNNIQDAFFRWGWLLLAALPLTQLGGRALFNGIAGLYAPAAVNQDARSQAEMVLRGVGGVVWVESESQLDAVTAVSGSGPAYVFYCIESLEAAAVAQGLSAVIARQLALQTFFGAAKLALESGEEPAVLRQRVTSRGGTTERGIAALEAAAVRRAIGQAVEAASRRSAELGDELGRLA